MSKGPLAYRQIEHKQMKIRLNNERTILAMLYHYMIEHLEPLRYRLAVF